ncbi:error-prone DNA polymerase, DnaE-like [Paramicrobacterium humi]|uniref:Error-prone DNA polymerase n=1 Tax=Paramicrobacterium humi TaxID=640635 RepID=A0A1H4Q350_9MICO|nr:error-prone DNA polymerase [Microbacterium humi]SEC14116.1 error-prone DNA polymerase, DnaE-like [Microbacterium humi]
MGWHNPPIPWSEFARRLSDEPAAPLTALDDGPRSRKREPYTPSTGLHDPEQLTEIRGTQTVPYAELHAHSAYSFLDGASMPEQLVDEAVDLGLSGMALTDHDGFYGAVRFAEAAAMHPDLKTAFGAELSLDLGEPQNGEPDPVGSHLLLLARGPEGYRHLAGAITQAQLADGAQKGSPRYRLDALGEQLRDHVHVLTGCRKGAVRQALDRGGRAEAGRQIDLLVDLFGPDGVTVELNACGDALDDARNDTLAQLASERGLPVVATGNIHFARPEQYRLAQALSAVRARRSLDEIDGWLPASGAAFLRSGFEMQALFGRFDGAISRSVELLDELSFSLRAVSPGLPKLPVPNGHTPMSWLRELVWRGAARKYPDLDASKRERIERELQVIEEKDFPGYFLIVYDIVQFARSRGILCQGRGSAANSAVCYLIDITAVDSIHYGLPFERFLSSMREEEPDIDVDFDSRRREEVIQYVYETYGRYNAAQVSNVISYRPKGAIRDMAKALGHSPGQQDAWSKQVERWGAQVEANDHDIPPAVIELAEQALKLPRHLGIHSGGMVLTDRPVGEVCPIEHARMDGRTVLQWDKDDCAWMGLVKFDLLGLGMLEALQYVFELTTAHCGETWALDTIPKDEPAVFDVLCRADSVGVFQVESRAQMGMLPRLQPRCFYDLVVEVALVRPGPIQGGAVHPYIKRRMQQREWEVKKARGQVKGEFPIPYLHPALEPVLKRTLGVPLFQEQLMQMAVAVGGCSAEDADQLRRAMGSKRGTERIDTLREKLYAGMAGNGITGEKADAVYEKIQAFANFGFAESHSISFALLVYASAWLRLHYPAAFLAALLCAQPMGFYSPQSLVADARRHGVVTRRPDILRSGVHPTLEADAAGRATGIDSCLKRIQPPVEPFDPDAPDTQAEHRRDGGFAVRLGLSSVRSVGEKLAERIVAERESGGAYRDVFDLARRTGANTAVLESLADAGAFECFGLSRREALWQAEQAAQEHPNQLEGTTLTVQPPLFGLLSPEEQTVSDIWATGISPDGHPIEHLRARLRSRGVRTAADLRAAETGRRIEVAGVVTHRQRPATARNVTFMNLEDETGLVNVVCSTGVWARYRRIAREQPALIVRGMLERSPEGVVNVVADRFEPLAVTASTRSRDFQ